MDFNREMGFSGLGGMLGGLFGDSGAPYDKAMQQYQQYGSQAQNAQSPYYNAGKEAIPAYQQWLQSQQNPTDFINNLMGQYQASPYSQYLQQQSQRAGQNAASASGLMGSTPMMQQMQQNSANISSQDMNKWLQHVLGINTQYGQGQQNLMNAGQGSANALSNLYNNMGQNSGEMAYNREASHQNYLQNMIGNGLGLFGSFFL